MQMGHLLLLLRLLLRLLLHGLQKGRQPCRCCGWSEHSSGGRAAVQHGLHGLQGRWLLLLPGLHRLLLGLRGYCCCGCTSCSCCLCE